MRLIDAEAFFEEEFKRCGDFPLVGTCSKDNEYLGNRLSVAPTIEAKPVVHGRWISKNPHGYEWIFVCSNCSYIDGYPFNDRSNYCPNCGAKMDGGIENG